MKARGLTTEVVLAGDELHAFLAPGNLPAAAVIDREGRVFGVGIGYFGEGSQRHLRELVRDALATSDAGF